MNGPSLVKDLFFFFARFVPREGVLSLFNQVRSDLPDYDLWLDEASALPEEPLISGIKYYVFGVDARAVANRISGLNDFFLFVDYGQIASSIDHVNNRIDSFYIAFTVAYPIRNTSTDLVERALQSDRALNILSDIRQALIREEKCIAWLKNFKADHVVTPWASETMPSFGWSAVIERQGADLLHGK